MKMTKKTIRKVKGLAVIVMAPHPSRLINKLSLFIPKRALHCNEWNPKEKWQKKEVLKKKIKWQMTKKTRQEKVQNLIFYEGIWPTCQDPVHIFATGERAWWKTAVLISTRISIWRPLYLGLGGSLPSFFRKIYLVAKCFCSAIEFKVEDYQHILYQMERLWPALTIISSTCSKL